MMKSIRLNLLSDPNIFAESIVNKFDAVIHKSLFGSVYGYYQYDVLLEINNVLSRFVYDDKVWRR